MLAIELLLGILNQDVNVLFLPVTTDGSFNKEIGQLLWSVLYQTGKKEENHVEILVELKPTHRC